jgi:hydrogenase small subunit
MSSVDKIHLIWLQGQACTGCTVSFLNATHPSVLDLLTGFIPQATGIILDYHATIMAPWGDVAIDALRSAEKGELGPFVLVVEGAVPDESFLEGKGFWCVTGEDEEGNPVTFNERLPSSPSGLVPRLAGSPAVNLTQQGLWGSSNI